MTIDEHSIYCAAAKKRDGAVARCNCIVRDTIATVDRIDAELEKRGEGK